MDGGKEKKAAVKKPAAGKKKAKPVAGAADPEVPVAPAPRVRATPFDPAAAVIAKYTEFGWTAIRAPKNSLNDIIAQKDKRLHFIQVVTPETIDDGKFTGLPKNTFIQNAFSNMAIPVYAHVLVSKKKDGSIAAKVTFEDVNLNTRIIVGGKKPAGGDEEKKATGAIRRD